VGCRAGTAEKVKVLTKRRRAFTKGDILRRDVSSSERRKTGDGGRVVLRSS